MGKYLLNESDPLHKRCIEYMNKLAERNGYTYSLEETHANRELLCAVWDACVNNTDPEHLKSLCTALVEASRVGVLQGIQHAEPADIDEYHRLFNFVAPRLALNDTRFSEPGRVELGLTWSFEADDKAVEKLTPGKQLTLPF